MFLCLVPYTITVLFVIILMFTSLVSDNSSDAL